VIKTQGNGASIWLEASPAEAEKIFNTRRARNPDLNIPEFKDQSDARQPPPQSESKPAIMPTPARNTRQRHARQTKINLG
jgi:hypothetical protein